MDSGSRVVVLLNSFKATPRVRDVDRNVSSVKMVDGAPYNPERVSLNDDSTTTTQLSHAAAGLGPGPAAGLVQLWWTDNKVGRQLPDPDKRAHKIRKCVGRYQSRMVHRHTWHRIGTAGFFTRQITTIVVRHVAQIQ